MRDFFDELNSELGKKIIPINKEIKPKEQFKQEIKPSNNYPKTLDHREIHTPGSLKEKLITNFPDTNFYLPTLRDKSLRILPIGGNSEKGKNMIMMQFGDEIILVNSGIQRPERGMLGAKYSIPDISFLIKVKEKIKGILITNIHEQNFGGLIEILSNLGKINIYTNNFTAQALKKALLQNNMENACNIKVLRNSEKFNAGKFEIKNLETYSSAPQNSSFIIKAGNNKALITYDLNVEKSIQEIKKEGIINTIILDSHSSNKKGVQRNAEYVKETIKEGFKNLGKGKTIVLCDSSPIKRISFVIDNLAKKGKNIFFASKDIQEIYKIAEETKIIKNSPKNLKKIINQNIGNIPESNKAFIVTGGIENEKSTINKIIDGSHNYISLEEGDNLILPNAFVFPEKRDIENSINDLIAKGVNVIATDFLDKDSDTHLFSDDIIKICKEIKPKYVIPVGGDGILRNIAKENLKSLGYKDIQIPLLNNGEMVDIDFKLNIFKSKIKAPIQNIIADGFGIGIAGSHVIKARKQMMNSGVLVIIFNVKENSREILGPIRLETRGLVYLDEVRQIHRIMIKKARAIYEGTLIDVPEIENKDLIKIIKTDLESYISKAIDREPMIIPIIIET